MGQLQVGFHFPHWFPTDLDRVFVPSRFGGTTWPSYYLFYVPLLFYLLFYCPLFFSLGDLIYFFFLSVADTHCSTHVGCPLTPAQKQSAGLSCKVHLHVQEEIKTFGRLTLWNTSVHHPEKKHMLPVALTWELCNFCCLIWIPSFTGCKSTQSMVS